jgi:hypothetical protein
MAPAGSADDNSFGRTFLGGIFPELPGGNGQPLRKDRQIRR